MLLRRLTLAALACGLLLVPTGFAEGGFLPGLDRVGTDEGEVYAKGCMAGDTQVRSRVCRFGRPGSERKVVLLGDSHAAHWGGALARLAKRRGWRAVVLARASCPAARVSIDKYCDIWRENALRRIKRIRPGLTLVGSAANDQAYSVLRYGHKLDRDQSEHRLVAGMVRTLRFLKRWSGRVILIRDQAVAPFDVTDCLRENWKRARRCGFRTTRSRSRSYDYKAARKVRGVRIIDPQRLLCPGGWCRPLDGRYLIYRNESHLAATWTRRQDRWLGKRIGHPWKPRGGVASAHRASRRIRDRASVPDFPDIFIEKVWPGLAAVGDRRR